MIKRYNTFYAVLILSLMCVLSACSKEHPALMHNEKAKLVNEQVLDHAKCTSYKKRLSTPVINDTVIKKAYQDAMQAGCINKDI